MSNKISNIKERILYLAENQEGNKQVFFKKIGMSYGNFTGKAKETPINSSAIEKILSNYPQTNINWLITGEGEMLKNEERNANLNEVLSASLNEENPIKSFDLQQEKNKQFDPNLNRLLIADLGMILDDNLKILYFLCNILKENNYLFSKKEKKDLFFYEGLDSFIMDIRTGKQEMSVEEFKILELIIKSKLFSTVNDYSYKVEGVLNINITYDFQEIFKK